MLNGLFSRMFGGSASDGAATLDELRAASATGSAHIVDVREPGEFAAGHAPGAINLPLSRFDPSQLPTDKPVILMCLSGARSGRANAACAAVPGVRHYPGGFSGWRNAGGAVEM